LRAEGDKGSRGLARYAAIGRKLVESNSISDAEAIDGCIQFTSKLVCELKIPALKQFGLRPEHTPEMITLARRASSMRFNPVLLSDESLAGALNAAIEGSLPY
jgi:alcohol dehydrogenase class IV